MKTYWGIGLQLHAFLTLELNGSELPALLPGKEPRCPLDRRLGEHQDRYGHTNKKYSYPAPAGNRTLVILFVA